MSWQSWRIPGKVWNVDGVRHAVEQYSYDDETCMWESLCGHAETPYTSNGGKKPRLFKGFVTCLQCLAKGGGDP